MKQRKLSILLIFIFILSLNINVFAAGDSQKTEPQIYGKAAVTIDMQTGEIIYSKDIDKQMYPASTTKLLTALLLAENKNKTDMLTYTQDAKAQPEYSLSVNLHPIAVGEKMSADNAMDGLLLYSGNDVAYMIADNIGKDAKDFSDKMNEKIKQLNLSNTHFVTPNGLHDPNHYTTAYDLSVIARAAFQNPWVKESMGKLKSTIKTSSGTTYLIENRNKLLGTDGCIGGKTGYTVPAGRCLVAIYDRGGRKILGVVMNSVYDQNDAFVFDDMKKVIDWSYAAKPVSLHTKDSVITTKTVKYKPLVFIGPEKSIDVPITIKEDINYYDNATNKKDLKEVVNLNDIKVSNLKGTDPIGTLTIKERSASRDYKLYSALPKGALMKNNLPIYGVALLAVLASLGVIAFAVKKILDIKRKRRRGKYTW
ncbi:D-alanyl-D-alanine carboxypeptidase family protein [Clostridium sp. OS1-26]|uniref:D-alanyl-D-alanine carboxypeptidase family protein n=1 Tax=Clostridium sp. OS1-26 TaxID=3070681 RepID=UPI0027DF46C9|nr:D-alanyl-D-alanine carboxypeptidase family protein [Clostridium sp. OS1-26]WML34546.1 D-alanyl-D-alanine carboxypeptidase family protein [Clostridium sp. OS1-26]